MLFIVHKYAACMQDDREALLFFNDVTQTVPPLIERCKLDFEGCSALPLSPVVCVSLVEMVVLYIFAHILIHLF